MNIFPDPPESRVVSLLAESGLSAADLTPGKLEHFFGCGCEQRLTGVVGVEIYASVALLRSLSVVTDCRGRGCGRALVAEAERHARSQGVAELYLLTTTAELFFRRLGYLRISREQAPPAIRCTDQFSSLCPCSSALMLRRLDFSAA